MYPPPSRSQQVGPAAEVHLDLDVLDGGGQEPPPSPGGLLPCHRRLGVDRLRAARRSEQHPRQYSYPFRRPVARVRDDPRLPAATAEQLVRQPGDLVVQACGDVRAGRRIGSGDAHGLEPAPSESSVHPGASTARTLSHWHSIAGARVGGPGQVMDAR